MMRSSAFRGGGTPLRLLTEPGCAPPFLGTQGERDAVGPPETVLRGVLAAAGGTTQVHDVVLLHHASRRAVCAPVERQPCGTRLVRQRRGPVSPHAFDRQPLERRPTVRRVPLLARR